EPRATSRGAVRQHRGRMNVKGKEMENETESGSGNVTAIEHGSEKGRTSATSNASPDRHHAIEKGRTSATSNASPDRHDVIASFELAFHISISPNGEQSSGAEKYFGDPRRSPLPFRSLSPSRFPPPFR